MAETETRPRPLPPEPETLTLFLETRPRRDVDTSRDRLETETSRPKRQPCISDEGNDELIWNRFEPFAPTDLKHLFTLCSMPSEINELKNKSALILSAFENRLVLKTQNSSFPQILSSIVLFCRRS